MSLHNKRICMILDAALICFVAVALLFMRSSREHRHFNVDRSRFPVKGVDISAHNGKIDFDSLRADTVSFVLMKATEGTDFCDAMFHINYNGARAAGLKTGAYHFFRFDTPANLQARHFLATINNLEFDMPLVVDVERWGNSKNFNPDSVKASLRVFIDAVHHAGYPLIIYTNKSDYVVLVRDNFADETLWLCSLSATPPPGNWTLWQHSHAGKVKGIADDVDINTFAGSAEAFEAAFKPFAVCDSLEPADSQPQQLQQYSTIQ